MARRFGHLPDGPDGRDRLFKSLYRDRVMVTAPVEVDYREDVQILEQGELGACVSNAGFGAIQLKHRLEGIRHPLLGNRLHGYWGARAYDKNTGWDAGSRIRNFFRFINSAGYMPEEKTENGYDISAYKKGPSRFEQRQMFDQKDKSQGQVRYYRIDEDGESRKQAIMLAIANDAPVVFGTRVNRKFVEFTGGGAFDDRSPPFEGSHAMYLAGYNRYGVWAPNSWGRDWGEEGFVQLPWDYILWKYTQDIWAVDRAPYYSERST